MRTPRQTGESVLIRALAAVPGLPGDGSNAGLSSCGLNATLNHPSARRKENRRKLNPAKRPRHANQAASETGLTTNIWRGRLE